MKRVKIDDIVWIGKDLSVKKQTSVTYWGLYRNNKMIKSKWLGVLYTESHNELIKNHPHWRKNIACLVMKVNLKSVIIICGKDDYLWKVPIGRIQFHRQIEYRFKND